MTWSRSRTFKIGLETGHFLMFSLFDVVMMIYYFLHHKPVVDIG